MVRKKRSASKSTLATVGTWILWIVQSSLFRTIIAAIVGGGVAGYTVSAAIPGMLPKGVLPFFDKIRPKTWKLEDAIGRIQFGNSGCTATIVGPISPGDTKIHILTAAHCVKMGANGRMKMKDGRLLNVRVVARSEASDVAWLEADRPEGEIPYLLLADVAPPPGTPIWHMGYGIDKPGNLERGTVKGITPNNLQVQYRLSVSPGDSGGGIVMTNEGRVVSPVCCTTRLSAMGDVWGGSPSECRRLKPGSTASYPAADAVHPSLDLASPAFVARGEPWVE